MLQERSHKRAGQEEQEALITRLSFDDHTIWRCFNNFHTAQDSSSSTADHNIDSFLLLRVSQYRDNPLLMPISI